MFTVTRSATILRDTPVTAETRVLLCDWGAWSAPEPRYTVSIVAHDRVHTAYDTTDVGSGLAAFDLLAGALR